MYIKWGTKYAKLLQNVDGVKAKLICTPDGASELINKWWKRPIMSLKVRQNHLETLTVSLVMKVVPKLLILLHLNELLDNSASLN